MVNASPSARTTRRRGNPQTIIWLSYRVQVTAPPGWSVADDNWELSYTLKTNYSGFNDTRKLRVAVPADAAPGSHALKLLISPASGTPQPLEVKLVVVSQNK
jgi:hypothetical protein